MKQRDKVQLIKEKARTIREIINLRSELVCLNKKNAGENWVNRAKFTINYFCDRQIDVFNAAKNWNDECEKALQNAWMLYNNKGQEIQDENVIVFSSRDNADFDETYENRIADEREPFGSLEGLDEEDYE